MGILLRFIFAGPIFKTVICMLHISYKSVYCIINWFATLLHLSCCKVKQLTIVKTSSHFTDSLTTWLTVIWMESHKWSLLFTSGFHLRMSLSCRSCCDLADIWNSRNNLYKIDHLGFCGLSAHIPSLQEWFDFKYFWEQF